MADDVPTTAEVRERFVDGFPMDTWVASRDECGADFDRWLAERDRLVAERAWDQGFDAGHYVGDEKRDCDCRNNPYRKEQENNNA